MSKPLGHTVNGAQHVVTAHQDASNHNCSRIANGMASGIPFTYDPIGDRVSASETIGGETLAKAYTANELNQYTTIANSDAVGLRGDATNTVVVTVNGQAVQSDNIASDTVPWHFALEADNANGSDFPFAEIMAVVNPPGTNTPDIVSTSSGHLYAPPQTETLTYDLDGNLLSDGRWHYTYNGENRLIKVEELLSPTNRQPYTVKYAYDHRGRMVWKQISTNAVVVSTRTLNWDDYNIIAETVAQDTATNLTYNIWGLDLDGTLQGAGGVGGLLAVVRDDETSFLTYDANGNVMEYLSADGTIVAHYEYSPFGEIVVQSGDLADSFTHRFSTKYHDHEIGLDYYGMRFYSPSLHRWLNRDPIEEDGGFNLYAFVGNNAICHVDSLGLAWGNFRAVKHFYFGGGQSVTLQNVGLYDAVTVAVKPKMREWKNKAKQSAENASSVLSCPSYTLTSTMNADSVGMSAVVFWMGGYSFFRKYFCSVRADCFNCSYSYKCILNYDVADKFVNPADFDNSNSDPWDAWQFGGTPYFVTGHWDDEVTGWGKLR